MTILQASFFWEADKPHGVGFTFGPPGFPADDLTTLFKGKPMVTFMKESDRALGSGVVKNYYSQIYGMAAAKQQGDKLPIQAAVMVALNIIWLVRWGFMVNDKFNGYQFVEEL